MIWIIIIAVILIVGLSNPKVVTFLNEAMNISYWLYKTIGYIVIAIIAFAIFGGFFGLI